MALARQLPRVGPDQAPEHVDLGSVQPDHVATVGQDPRTQIRPLVGGTRLSGPSAVGTLGLVVAVNNVTSLVTAGHVAGPPGTVVEQPGGGAIVGVVRANGYTPAGGIDVAATSVAAGVPAEPWEIFGALVNYSVTGIADWPVAKQNAEMQGAETGYSSGTVVYPNATVKVGNAIPQGVSVATYASVPGDSGAPVVDIDGDSVTLLGIHGGRFVAQGNEFAYFTPVETFASVIAL
jgi:hypothetical protein